jgi:2-keto-4-pentenoate hydratase
MFAAARPIIEIQDARTIGDEPWPGTVIADSGRHALLVPGQRIELATESRLEALTLQLRIDTERGRVMRMRPHLQATIDALDWLADAAAAMHEPLRQGELIVVGRPTPPEPLQPGCTYWSELAGVGLQLAVAGLRTDRPAMSPAG